MVRATMLGSTKLGNQHQQQQQQQQQQQGVSGSATLRAAEQGFTLIELMMVVVILSILLGIAMPRYGDHISKARRNDARAALLEMAAVQERLHFERNQYSAAIADLWINKDGDDYVSADGHYVLTAGTADSGQEFTVTATARGVQTGDGSCTTFSVTQSGARMASDGSDDTSSVCW